MLGSHEETVRYKIKKQFKSLGFRIHADVDYRALGLELHWATLRFPRGQLGSANRILTALNEVGYLTYFARIVPQGFHVALFALPAGSSAEYRKFLDHLKTLGIVDGYTLTEVLVSRHNSMNPKYFNFRSGTWDLDWNKVRLDKVNPLTVEAKKPVFPVDLYDLLVIKELQKDALQHLVEIGRKLKMNQKTLEYHYRTHVQKERLIPAYTVRWTQDIERSLAHSVQFTRLEAAGLSTDDLIKLQAAVSKIPFLWAEELLKDGTYIATILIPSHEAVSTFDYISSEVPNLDSKISVGYIRPHDAYLFTIPHNMFVKGWSFSLDRLESDFSAAMKSQKKLKHPHPSGCFPRLGRPEDALRPLSAGFPAAAIPRAGPSVRGTFSLLMSFRVKPETLRR